MTDQKIANLTTAQLARAEQVSDVLLLAGRLALVAVFLWGGFNKLMSLDPTAAYIASKGLPGAPLLAPLTGAFEIAAGLLVAIGYRVRLTAAALVVFIVVASVIFHDFWNMTAQARAQNAISFYKNLSMIGGFLILAVVGPGRYSLRRS